MKETKAAPKKSGSFRPRRKEPQIHFKTFCGQQNCCYFFMAKPICFIAQWNKIKSYAPKKRGEPQPRTDRSRCGSKKPAKADEVSSLRVENRQRNVSVRLTFGVLFFRVPRRFKNFQNLVERFGCGAVGELDGKIRLCFCRAYHHPAAHEL